MENIEILNITYGVTLVHEEVVL